MTEGSDFAPAIRWMRTPEERRNPVLSWWRPDHAFFASGACHILAFCFLDRHPGEGYEVVLLQPRDGHLGSHVWVSGNGWAFDFNGWTREDVLLRETIAACRERWPGWDYDLVTVTSEPRDELFKQRNLRTPPDFPGDVLARADAYLDMLPPAPPD